MLQDTQLNPANIAVCLTEKKIGFSLDNADLVITISLLLYILLISFYILIFFKSFLFFPHKVFMPIRKNSFWYVVVANFRDKRFEVIWLFQEVDPIKDDTSIVVTNFKKAFKAVHSRSSRVEIYNLPTVFGSVANYNNQLRKKLLLCYPHPHTLKFFLTFLFFMQEWQWCFCDAASVVIQWKDSLPLQTSIKHDVFRTVFISLHSFMTAPPHPPHAGTRKANPRIANLLSLHAWG